MPDRAVRVFLDSNVVGDLIDWDRTDPAPIREQLLQATRSGVICVVGSLEVLSELAGARCFRSANDFLLELVNRWWMLPLLERIIQEVARGGQLPEEEPYLSRELRRELKHFRERQEKVRTLAKEVRERAEKYKADSEKARAEVIAHLRTTSLLPGGGSHLPADALRNAMWAWWKAGHVAEWCRDMLDAGVSRKWFAQSKDHWADPKSLSPTLWAYMSYRLLRIALEVGEGRGIQPSDEYDARHYSAAAVYADVLVTEDRGFSKICEKLEGTDLEIIGLLELHARVEAMFKRAGIRPRPVEEKVHDSEH